MPLPERYRRLWRRRLRRRPLLPFLLLISLSCGLTCSLAQPVNPYADNPWVLSLGAAIALFGLTGIWILNRCRGWIQRTLVSGLWLLGIVHLLGPIDGGMRVMGTMCFVIVLATALLGTLVRLPWCWINRGLSKVSRQLTIGYLLLLTTFVAVAIFGLQQLHREVLNALIVDPTVTGYLLAEVTAAPAFLLVSRMNRSTVTAACWMSVLAIAFLLLLNVAFPKTQVPELFKPPHYYHVGLLLMTAVWVLGMRPQPHSGSEEVSKPSANGADVDKEVEGALIETPPTSIDLRA